VLAWLTGRQAVREPGHTCSGAAARIPAGHISGTMCCGRAATYICLEVVWVRWQREDASCRRAIKLPWRALEHVEAVVPVLVKGPLAVALLDVPVQPVVEQLGGLCSMAGMADVR
jgi:hypothetical protein